MKIIGQTKNGFILDASKQEVANLVGFYSQFDIGHIKVGVEIEVHKMYHQLYELKNMERDLEQILAKLEEYAKELRPLMPIQNCPLKCPTNG